MILKERIFMAREQEHFGIGEYDFEYFRLIGSPHLVLSDLKTNGSEGQLSLGALRALELPKIEINEKINLNMSL